MGQWSTDFSQYDDEEDLIASAEWIRPWGAGGVAAEVLDNLDGAPTSGKRAVFTQTASASPHLAQWQEPDTHADMQVYAIVRRRGAAAGGQVGLGARTSGTGFGGAADADNEGYSALFRNGTSDMRISRHEDGNTDLGEEAHGLPDGGVDVWCEMLFEVRGTTQQMKIWPHGDGEPGSWPLTFSDTAVSGAGRPGIVLQRFGDQVFLDVVYLSVGTDTDDAPRLGEGDPEPPWSLTVNTEGEGSVVVEDDGTPVDPETHDWDDEDPAELSATPDSGWQVADPLWTGPDAPGDANENPTIITMDADKNLTANFEEEPAPEPGDANRRVRYSGQWWPSPT